MAVLETLSPDAEALLPAPVKAGAPIRAMAIGLWAVVGSLLSYGVIQTVLKAAALFS